MALVAAGGGYDSARATEPVASCDARALLKASAGSEHGAEVLVDEAGDKLLAEGILWHPTGRWFLVSGRQGIFRYSATGKELGRWGEIEKDWSVAGLALDPKAPSVWAVATAAGKSKVLRLALDSGVRLAEYQLPGEDQWYGDLAVAPDGTVFVGIARSVGILRLAPGGSDFMPVALDGQVRGPQGMFVTPDGSTLIVADYTSGLKSVDLRSGTVRSIDWTNGLPGIDGLLPLGSSVIAVQNGVKPFAVLRLDLDASTARVRNVSRMAEKLWPKLTACSLEPTLVDRRDSYAYVVVRSIVEGAPSERDRSLVLRLALTR